MNGLQSFFLFCAGVDRAILTQCPTDDNKYMGIGATVFFTGVLAFFSAGYALYTVFDNWAVALLFGVVWGLMIFNLDRYIVSSMKLKKGFFGNFFVALPRLVLAVLLALVISKPLELKIFEKEINAELLVMEQEKFKEQEDGIMARFTPQITAHQATIDQWKTEIKAKTQARDEKVQAALAEADGSGGSQIRNMGPIYKAKKAEADQAQTELDTTLARLTPLIAEKELQIKDLETQSQTALTSLERSAFGGLAARSDALSRLAGQSEAIALASLFIMLLFVAVETAPIMVKLISPRSPYDYLLAEHEQQFELAATEVMEMRKSEVMNKISEFTEVGLHQTRANITQRKAVIDTKLQENLDRLKRGDVVVE